MATLSHGYDFSAYQGNTVPKGVFGWVKTSEGISYKNAKFDAQWASALDNWEAPGVYHFAHPEKSTPAKQIAMISSMVALKAGKHTVMLDLETSELSQKYTNEWAVEFGEGLRDTFPGVSNVSYFGGGYATNGTGKGLAKHFDHWVYPQYPGVYRLAAGPGEPSIDELRAINRSQLLVAYFTRLLLSAPKSNWPTSMDEMYMPSGAMKNTGFTPDRLIWQFSDNHTPGAIDASVSSMTAAEILSGGNAIKEELELYGGPMEPADYEDASVPHGSLKAFGIYCSSTEVTEYRLEVNNKDAGTVDVYTGTVGGPRMAKGGVKKKVISLKHPADIDGFRLENLGPAKFGWDAS
jgi:hypothetical protein